jgi:hypothetical protein
LFFYFTEESEDPERGEEGGEEIFEGWDLRGFWGRVSLSDL